MQNPPIIFSVSEVTQAIKAQLEPCFRHIWVRGEVTNYRLQSSGHHYFSLMEGGALLSCVMFRAAASSLPQPIKTGDTVIAEGEISVYPPRGSYQLVVRMLTNVGLGEALLKLKALKQKLSALGWFLPERKRPLPPDIRKIALVTSPTGAVLHDIINILTRRLGGFHLIVNPVRVQGEGAAEQIARAIQEINLYSLADVIIICRGGGSAEDLAAFNEEKVAAACVQSTIPIVSAIGHETDLSITDLVSDLRAPTPSAAAELVSHERSERRERLRLFSDAALKLVSNRLRTSFQNIHTFAKRIEQSSPQKKAEHYSLRLDDLTTSTEDSMKRLISTRSLLLSQMGRALRQQAPSARLSEQRTRVLQLEKAISEKLPLSISILKKGLVHISHLIDERMGRHMMRVHERYSARDWTKEITTAVFLRIKGLYKQVDAITSNLAALSPKRTLERGYAIVFRENSRQVIRSIQMVAPQEAVTIMVSDGTISARINTATAEQRGLPA